MRFDKTNLPVISAKDVANPSSMAKALQEDEKNYVALNPKAKSPLDASLSKKENFRVSTVFAVMLHLSIVYFLVAKSSLSTPTLQLSAQNKQHLLDDPDKPSEKAIKAVSVDAKQVMAAIETIKQERLEAKMAEERKQHALEKKAKQARKKRQQEQQRIAKLKREARELEKARQKKAAEEQARLKALEKKRAQEQAQLEALKNEQKALAEKKRQEALQKQKVQQELARKREEAAKKAEAESKRRAAAIAGEVNKYKALIINAISQQWILPEDVNEQLSSQFRIRLAPNGAVLEVSLVRSSGDPILDRSAKSAIYKASPLPVPSEPEAFRVFRDIHLTVRPESVRG